MHFDAIVIGGGIIGVSSAYELTKTGMNVLLVEKRHVGSGASGASAAMLECQVDAHRGEPFFTLSYKSQMMFPALYTEISDLTGIDFQLEKSGILQLASTERDAEFLQREVGRQSQMSLRSKWFTPDELQFHYPQLNPTHFGGAFYKEDGQVNGELFAAGMAKAARLNGTRIEENVGSAYFKMSRGQIDGLMTPNETFTADHYVLTAGAWSDQVLEPLNIKLGLVPFRGQLVIYDTPRRPIDFPIYTRKNGYVTPKKTGYTLVGSTIENVGFDETTTEIAKRDLIKIGTDLLPGLSRMAIRGMSAGLRPGSPDGLPLLGKVAEYENLIIATGHYRNGVLLSPITALIVAALANRSPLPLDIAPYSPSRTLTSLAH